MASSSTMQLAGFKRRPDEGPALSAEPMVDMEVCERARLSRHWDNPVCMRMPGLEKECSRPDQCPYYVGSKPAVVCDDMAADGRDAIDEL